MITFIRNGPNYEKRNVFSVKDKTIVTHVSSTEHNKDKQLNKKTMKITKLGGKGKLKDLKFYNAINK